MDEHEQHERSQGAVGVVQPPEAESASESDDTGQVSARAHSERPSAPQPHSDAEGLPGDPSDDDDLDEVERAPERGMPLDPAEAIQNEDELLDALLDAGDIDVPTRVCRVKLKNDRIVYIRLRGLDEKEEEAARKKARNESQTKGKGRKGAIKRLLEDASTTLWRSHMILQATVAFCLPEGEPNADGLYEKFRDVETLWDRTDVRAKLDVRSKAEVVDKVLPAGQKTALMEVIEELSGYAEDVEAEAGN